MTTRTIPAKTIFTCDKCEAEGVPLSSGAFEYGYAAAVIKHGGKSAMGDTGGGEMKVDLCGTCFEKLRSWLKERGA